MAKMSLGVTRIEFKLRAFYQLRTAPEVRRDLASRAHRIARLANQQANLDDQSGYRVGTAIGARRPQGRARATVIAGTEATRNDNDKNNRLLRCLHAGRG